MQNEIKKWVEDINKRIKSIVEGLTLGQRIASYRAKKQLLQKELAEKADISPTALNYYEKDKREPNVITIIRLAKALEVTGDELLGIYSDNSTEKQLIKNFRLLNQEGQEKVVDYIDDLISSDKYIKSNSYKISNEKKQA